MRNSRCSNAYSLSCICSTLTEFRKSNTVTVCSICSLSGLVALRPSANPLSPKGREYNNYGHSERSEESPKHFTSHAMFLLRLNMTELSPRPIGEADCELRANRLAEVQGCADPLNANNQAG